MMIFEYMSFLDSARQPAKIYCFSYCFSYLKFQNHIVSKSSSSKFVLTLAGYSASYSKTK